LEGILDAFFSQSGVRSHYSEINVGNSNCENKGDEQTVHAFFVRFLFIPTSFILPSLSTAYPPNKIPLN
jgi:hypothetical protein